MWLMRIIDDWKELWFNISFSNLTERFIIKENEQWKECRREMTRINEGGSEKFENKFWNEKDDWMRFFIMITI